MDKPKDQDLVFKLESVVKNLKKYGFSKGKGSVLTLEEIEELEQIIDHLHSDPLIKLDYCSNAPVVVGLAGRSARLDYFLEKMLTSVQVKDVLKNILGKTYKIWQIDSRISEVGDKGLGLHQDSLGQVNFVFFISNQESGGVTGFLPRSHLLPRWARNISWGYAPIAKYFLTALAGSAGEHAFFFNKTWHARLPNQTGFPKKVIMIAFFPESASYAPDPFMTDSSCSISGRELNRLISVKEGVDILSDNRVLVSSKKLINSNKLPYSIEIEKSFDFSLKTAFVYFKICFLELLFRPAYCVYWLLRSKRKVSTN